MPRHSARAISGQPVECRGVLQLGRSAEVRGGLLQAAGPIEKQRSRLLEIVPQPAVLDNKRPAGRADEGHRSRSSRRAPRVPGSDVRRSDQPSASAASETSRARVAASGGGAAGRYVEGPCIAERATHPLGQLRDRQPVQRARADVEGSRQGRVRHQGLNIHQVAAQAIEHVLPWPRRCGVADRQGRPLTHGAHDVRHEPVLAEVASADDVAAAAVASGTPAGSK